MSRTSRANTAKTRYSPGENTTSINAWFARVVYQRDALDEKLVEIDGDQARFTRWVEGAPLAVPLMDSSAAFILVFIGFKLVLHWAHGIWPQVPEMTITFSLAVIVIVLTVTTIASLVAVRHNPELRAHAGSFTDKVDRDSPGV